MPTHPFANLDTNCRMYLSIVVVLRVAAVAAAGPLAPAYPSTQESLIDNAGSTDSSDAVFTAKIFVCQ